MRPWTRPEVEFLRDNCGKSTCAAIARVLGRDVDDVMSTSRRLGLRTLKVVEGGRHGKQA